MAAKEASLPPSPPPPPLSEVIGEKAGQKKRRPWHLIGGVIIVAVVVVVLALALGLGLGLGLKKHSNKATAQPQGTAGNASSPTTPPSYASQNLTPLRLDTKDYNLDMTDWDIAAPPTTRTYNFTLSEVEAAPDGVLRKVLVINGYFPGPLIRANRGDRVLVNVTNQLSNVTSIHWHGVFQRGTNWMDGSVGITQCPIPPGRSFMYNFTVDNQYGTYWYHSHYGTQYTDGLVGPLIIHAPEEKQARESYDYDQVILLSDWYHDLSAALLPGYLASGNENNEPVPDNGLIQGTNYFNCSSLDGSSQYTCQDNSTRAVFPVQQHKRYRYRLINTGAFAPFAFSVDNHTLAVIEADGTIVQPLNIHRLEIAVAQRYSVILNANQTASNYWIRAQMNTFCFATDNPILDPDVKALLTYTNSTDGPSESVDWSDAVDDECEDLNATLLVPSPSEEAPPAQTLYAVQFSFQIGDYALDRAYVNGTSWTAADVPTLNQAVNGLKAGNSTFDVAGVSSAYTTPNQYVIDLRQNQVVDLLVTNFDDGSHPFHLHGHKFWIIATSDDQYFDWSSYGSLNTTNPISRDTLTIDAFGWALIRFRSDNPGLWALHCHISWHMEAGLLMQFQARNDLMKDWTLPKSVTNLCIT